MDATKHTVISLKKTLVLFSIGLLSAGPMFSQSKSQVYDNFEGDKSVHYGTRNGTLDTMATNPAPGKNNNSAHCAKYVRNAGQKFDNLKMSVDGKLGDVSSYATYTGNPPKLKMKIYTTAPAGTMVEVLLGSKGRNNEFPAGTHSQYQARTTTSGAWEEIEFKFSQIPKGSETSAEEVNQLTLMFNPNSNTSDVYYFDEITGPPVEKSVSVVKPKTEMNNEKMAVDKNKKK